MRVRNRIAVAAVAVLGIFAGAGMGLLANEISGDSIGLSPKPLRAGGQLAPPGASTTTRTNARPGTAARGGRDARGHGEGGGSTTTPTTVTHAATTPTETAPTTTSTGEDEFESEDSESESEGHGSDD